MSEALDATAGLPSALADALGIDAITEFARAVANYRRLAQDIPDTTQWAVLTPIIGNRAHIEEQVVSASKGSSSAWHVAFGQRADGQSFALASDLISSPGSERAIIELTLFDLHPRMSAWALTALWRADELTDGLIDSLTAWRPIASAALSRSLFEGALAFVSESGDLADAWDEMKQEGPPAWDAAWSFRGKLNAVLVQAQFGSRIGQPSVRRTSPMKLIEAGAQRTGLDLAELKETYNWLCDAVHPGWGFQTAYTMERGRHESKTQTLELAGRGRPGQPGPFFIEPTVARMSVHAATVALDQLVGAWPRLVSVIDDYGLTTGVCFASRLDYWRRFDRPARNDRCPCGSGLKFKACLHSWGVGCSQGTKA